MTIQERKLFIQQLKENFEHTGALTPSSRFLANAIVSELKKKTKPVLILEVGPGTGVFTKEIVKLMNPGDQLHICEINTLFCRHLEKMIQTEDVFTPARNQIRIINAPLQELNISPHYDYIVSSLPLNNFPVNLVKEIQTFFVGHLKNGGTLSYFEYIGIRRTKILFKTGEEKRKLKELDKVLRDFVKKYQKTYQVIPMNLPPAYARHLQF